MEDAISTLQLLLNNVWETDDVVLQDLKIILEGVLTKVRSIFRVLKEYEERNNTETMQLHSFTCPTSKLAGAGKPVIVVEREQCCRASSYVNCTFPGQKLLVC